MRKITCAQCGHEDHVEDVRYELGRPAQAIDRRELRALSAAIHQRRFQDAATSLDRIFRDEPLLREEIEIGRFQRRAG